MENNPFGDPIEDRTIRLGNKPSYRRYFYPILAVIALLVLGVIFSFLVHTGKTAGSKQGALSREQRSDLMAQVTEAQQEIQSLSPDATPRDRYKAYVKLSAAHYNLGQYQEALSALDKIKDENANQPALWQRYTLIYMAMGDNAKARENAERTLDLDDTVPGYWLTLIDTYQNESSVKVKVLYALALSRTENDPEIQASYAKYLQQVGQKPMLPTEPAPSQTVDKNSKQTSKPEEFSCFGDPEGDLCSIFGIFTGMLF